jgi:hypothetical protein
MVFASKGTVGDHLADLFDEFFVAHLGRFCGGLESPPFSATFFQTCLERELADLAFGFSQAPIVLGKGPLALQALLAGIEELVTPSGDPMRLDTELTGELLQLLPAEQSQHHVHLPSRRPPGLRAEVLGSFVVHRHKCHLGPSLIGLQRSQVRATPVLRVVA